MIDPRSLLAAGARLKADVLHNYACLGDRDGQALARQMAFEIGEAMVSVHGRGDAASIFYNIGDAISARLPISDWRIPALEPVSEQPPAPSACPPAALKPPSSIRQKLEYALTVLSPGVMLAVGFMLGLWLGGRS